MNDLGKAIEQANDEALRRMLAAEPVLIDVRPAGDVIPTLTDGVILHAGPPIAWGSDVWPDEGSDRWDRRLRGLVNKP